MEGPAESWRCSIEVADRNQAYKTEQCSLRSGNMGMNRCTDKDNAELDEGIGYVRAAAKEHGGEVEGTVGSTEEV